MVIAHLEFDGRFSWRLDKADPSLFSIPSLQDWKLLSPLLYGDLAEPQLSSFMEYAVGRYLGHSSCVIFVRDGSMSDSSGGEDGETERLTHSVSDLLVRLRHLTGQASLPKAENIACLGLDEIESIPQLNFPETVPAKFKMQEYLFRVSITAKHFDQAAQLGTTFDPPTYEVLFLDAVSAHRTGDHRTSVLYSAMSMEVAFGAVIETAYEKILNGPPDDRFRVLPLRSAGGATQSKDPIYTRLRDRNDFAIKMHELSLYVLRKSLLAENETLFQNAKRLYKTRNSIVHAGKVDDSNEIPPFPLDRRGSYDALRTAKEAMSWLGVCPNAVLPTTGFVSIPALLPEAN